MAAVKKPDKQVMDISKPGKTPASPSSRPVIIGHRPMVQDPMVTSAEENNTETTESDEVTPKITTTSKRVITPISEAESTASSADENTEVAQEVESASSDGAETQLSADTEESKISDNQDASNDSEAAVVDSVIDQVDIGSKREAEQKAEEERKKQEALDKLIAEKKYFVPIGKTHKKTKNGIGLLTLFLAVVLISMLLAIDAGLLEVSFDLPFDFIK